MLMVLRIRFTLMLITLVAISVSVAAEDATEQTIVKALVTDREDNPLEGAKIVSMDWFDTGEQVAPEVLTNANGEFEIGVHQKGPRDTHVSNYVIIYKEGYAVGALNLDVLPARARLWPMKPTPIRVVDDKLQPLRGARVTLGEIGFNDEFLHANIPPALAKEIGVVSRDDGWAILRCSRPEFVHSVAVKAKGYGTQEFATAFHEDRFHRLQLWPTTPAKVRVMVGEQPAAGWKLFATTSDVLAADPLAAAKGKHDVADGYQLPKGISLIATTDQDGYVQIEHALLLRTTHLMMIGSDQKWRGTGTLVATENAQEPTVLQGNPAVVDVGNVYEGKVIDADTGAAVPDVEIYFQSVSRVPDMAEAMSDASGKITAKLSKGSWYVRVTKSPDGYCQTLTSETQIVIPEDGPRRLADVTVPKGRTIKGSIQGVDLSIRRARWLRVGWSSGEESGQINGRFEPDGSFSVTIPERAVADSFAIVALGGGSDDLEIKSRDPLVLTSPAQQ